MIFKVIYSFFLKCWNFPTLRVVRLFVYHFFGFRYIWSMIATPEIDEQLYVERFKKYNGLISFMRRKPSSFVFWFIGIYSTIYSLALGSHQITENRVMDTFVKLQTQIGFKPDQYSLRQIAGLSNTKTTSVPKFTQPVTIKDAILEIGRAHV